MISKRKVQTQICVKLEAYPVELSGWKATVTGGLSPRAEVGQGWAGRITVLGKPLTVVRVTRELQRQPNKITTITLQDRMHVI